MTSGRFRVRSKMALNPNPASFARRDKAAEKKEKKNTYKESKFEYEYIAEQDDIILKSGRYAGNTLRNIFQAGQKERDYIVKTLWYLNDPVINKVIESMLYQEV